MVQRWCVDAVGMVWRWCGANRTTRSLAVPLSCRHALRPMPFQTESLGKFKEGVDFYVKGTKMLFGDVVYAMWLFKRTTQGYTLKPREVCVRAPVRRFARATGRSSFFGGGGRRPVPCRITQKWSHPARMILRSTCNIQPCTPSHPRP